MVNCTATVSFFLLMLMLPAGVFGGCTDSRDAGARAPAHFGHEAHRKNEAVSDLGCNITLYGVGCSANFDMICGLYVVTGVYQNRLYFRNNASQLFMYYLSGEGWRVASTLGASDSFLASNPDHANTPSNLSSLWLSRTIFGVLAPDSSLQTSCSDSTVDGMFLLYKNFRGCVPFLLIPPIFTLGSPCSGQWIGVTCDA
eukprot:RCo045306